MKKKIIALALAVTTLVLAVAGGTLAYLTDTSSSINVATVGNVKIAQYEYQLDGKKLVDFEQGQPLYPAFANSADAYDKFDHAWGDAVTAENAKSALWDSEKLVGVMDKFVFVENKGFSKAYYRTWIAIECPDSVAYGTNEDDIIINKNDVDFTWEVLDEKAIINETKYLVLCASAKEALEPKEKDMPSLLQVVMTANADNEDTEAMGTTMEILAFTQAVQVDNMPSAEAALVAAFKEIDIDNIPWSATDYEMEYPTVVTNAEEFTETLAAAGAAGAGDSTIYIAADIDMTDVEWTPVYVNGYQGADIVTVEGQGHTIKGLTAPLFKGGFAGGSGIVIKDLTIADSEIVSDNTQGSGAFIECVDSMETITLDNCHLINSSVTGSRTGGLVGWTSGYSNQNDGPVKTYVNITNCSVIKCKITGTAVGGINGHAGASDWTFTTIDNCTVVGNTLVSTDDGDWRVGSIIGTANVGEVTISNITHGNNELKQDNASSGTNYDKNKFVGRFVPGSTGKLVIDEEAVTPVVTNKTELKDALSNAVADGKTNVTIDALGANIGDLNYGISVPSGTTVTLANATVTGKSYGNAVNGTLVFENCTFENPNGAYSIHFDAGSGNVVFNNCVLSGWSSFGAAIKSVELNNCEIKGNGFYAMARFYQDTVMNNCVIDCSNTNTNDIYVDGISAVNGATITMNNCTVINAEYEVAENGKIVVDGVVAAEG